MSAYVIEVEKYNKFYNALATMFSDSGAHNPVKHPLDWCFKELRQQPDDPCKSFVAKMWALNIASVNYRYAGNPTIANLTPDEDAHAQLLKRDMRGRFPVVSVDSCNPVHMQELGGFIRCWNYQSCEIPESSMTKEQREVMDTASALKSAFYEHGLKRALKRDASWGDLEIEIQPQVRIM